MGGLEGEVTFEQTSQENVTIRVRLTGEEPSTFSWSIRDLSAALDSAAPCNSLGRARHDFSRRHGKLDLGPNSTELVFEDDSVKLGGSDTIWGRALLLQGPGNRVACATVMSEGPVATSRAVFRAPIAGILDFRQTPDDLYLIYCDLYHVRDSVPPKRYTWNLLVADVLDDGRRGENCAGAPLFDPGPHSSVQGECSRANHTGCRAGNMTAKHGPLPVSRAGTPAKRVFLDMHLPRATAARLLVTILDDDGRSVACARVRMLDTRELVATVEGRGLRAKLVLRQRHPSEPTSVRARVQRNPFGEIPTWRVLAMPPPCDSATFDAFSGSGAPAAGALSIRNGPFRAGTFHDTRLPLFGSDTVSGRAVLLEDDAGRPIACAALRPLKPGIAARAIFYYPVAGTVELRQEDPDAETTVLVQLAYTDGSTNRTMAHRMAIHRDAPGRDFYDWQNRCRSVGPRYDPSQAAGCRPGRPFSCAIGDITGKTGRRIEIGAVRPVRFYHADGQLPLSGPHSVLHRAFVIHDDGAPPHRGDRLACTRILPLHPVKASVRRWRFADATQTDGPRGHVIWTQETPEDPVYIDVELRGLEGQATRYGVRTRPVPLERRFPCHDDALGPPWPERNVTGPTPAEGSLDQYLPGDLSGKLGPLDGKEEVVIDVLDPSIQLFGSISPIGRSVAVRMNKRDRPWACGTVRPEIEPGEGREIVALASFDDPAAALQGYIRLRQLEYKDDSASNTYIEVDLRYPGKYDRNQTEGHEWSIFVNRVAHDAIEPNERARCIAAGYRWNPYIVVSNTDGYKKTCAPDQPLRCEMGDLTGKHGSLRVGFGKAVFADSNLPLVGNSSVLGRSVIISGAHGNPARVACANLLPDIHLVRHVAVRKFPGFSSGTFMDHMRQMLNMTDWLVEADAQAEHDLLDGQCTQLTVHFFGSEAHRNQIEFGNLLTLGSVRKQTRLGLRLVKTYYKPCKSLDEEFKDGGHHLTLSWPLIVSAFVYLAA
ncbi:uncharacterized protein LOC135378267 [Ornithodoros turicata]|uniref:uncharacterized protein LOC135378267 n=1 Tax=Ornithodoros turicata TaxID=34597 RepID=UPI0031391CDB